MFKAGTEAEVDVGVFALTITRHDNAEQAVRGPGNSAFTARLRELRECSVKIVSRDEPCEVGLSSPRGIRERLLIRVGHQYETEGQHIFISTETCFRTTNRKPWSDMKNKAM